MISSAECSWLVWPGAPGQYKFQILNVLSTVGAVGTPGPAVDSKIICNSSLGSACSLQMAAANLHSFYGGAQTAAVPKGRNRGKYRRREADPGAGGLEMQ
jgi:hypothetical protein